MTGIETSAMIHRQECVRFRTDMLLLKIVCPSVAKMRVNEWREKRMQCLATAIAKKRFSSPPLRRCYIRHLRDLIFKGLPRDAE